MTDSLGRLQSALTGRYTIERELGRGGMATVYLARDLKHHRRVAIKVLRPELTGLLGPDRFLREIDIAAGLTHPHILPLHDSGIAADLLYYVMPFVEGESLRDRLDRERQLPIPIARAIAREVADALDHAHAHGVLHRDIKPDNVLLSGSHAFVTDFGVAKAIDAASGATTSTTPGIALGTPAYMAPEQATADPATDHRADLYALGVVLYEMLAGQAPFGGGSRAQILAAHISAIPQPVTELRPDCPAPLGALVMRCLEKAPDARPQSAETVVRTLDAMQTPDLIGRSRRARSLQIRRGLLAAVLGTLLILGSAAAFVPHSMRARLLTLLRRPDAALLSSRVLVAPFSNQTGDSTLDALGPMASDWIGQGLSGVSGIEVVDPRTALATQAIVQHIPWPLRTRDEARAMAREVGAGTLVSGTIYREGDSLLFQAKITDVVHGRLVRALAPVVGRRSAPSQTLMELQHRVAGSIVLAATTGTSLGGFAEPPSLDAYEEMYRGVEAYFRGDRASQYAHLERAARLDTTYTTPLVLLAFAHAYNFEYRIADSVMHRAEQLAVRLAPGERAFLDHLEALVGGDQDGALRGAAQLASLTPGSPESQLLLASTALAVRKPRLALDALTPVDPDRGLNLAGPFYWIYQSEAAAELGNWPRSLTMAQAGLQRFPEAASLYHLKARAFARLGRVAEMEETIAALPAQRDPLVEQSQLAVEMWGELCAIGRRGAADSLGRYYARLLDDAQDDTSRATRFTRARILLRAGRLVESRVILETLAVRDTGMIHLQDVAQLGIVSAMLGDLQAARRTEQLLAAANPHYQRGIPKRLQAQVAAALGERERAVQLLRQALALGVGLESLGGGLAGDSDLEPLFGYPAFEELLKPTR